MELDPDDPRPVWLLDVDGVLNTSRNAWNYKCDAAWEVLAAGRRLIWTDDDIPTFGPLRERFDPTDALLITTAARRGLTPEHMDEIEAFARHVRVSS